MTETWRGPAILEMGNKRFTIERTVDRVDDWRDTPWGPVNFGHVRLGPQRLVRLDSTPTP